jgi:hypothetical protein
MSEKRVYAHESEKRVYAHACVHCLPAPHDQAKNNSGDAGKYNKLWINGCSMSESLRLRTCAQCLYAIIMYFDLQEAGKQA